MIARFEQTEDDLLVWLDQATDPMVLPWFWVRDHSQDPSSVDQRTAQRTVDTFTIDQDLTPAETRRVGDEIHVRWLNGTPDSVLTTDLLSSLDGAVAVSSAAGPQRPELWSKAADLEIEPVPFTALTDGSTGLPALLASMARSGFGTVSGVPGSPAGVEALADSIGYVRRSIYGDIWPLSSDLTDHADSAYEQTYLEPHTDGTYCHDGPGLQLFVCAERTGTGGESILVDGFAAAEQLRSADPEAFAMLSTVAVPAHYREPGVDLRAARPTIRLEQGTVVQVSFNNYDRSPFLLPPDRMRQWYSAYRAFHQLIIDQSSWWVGRLEPGDALVFDNWRCLHGRKAYTGRRSFFGCYLNHEDLESKLRTGPRSA